MVFGLLWTIVVVLVVIIIIVVLLKVLFAVIAIGPVALEQHVIQADYHLLPKLLRFWDERHFLLELEKDIGPFCELVNVNIYDIFFLSSTS